MKELDSGTVLVQSKRSSVGTLSYRSVRLILICFSNNGPSGRISQIRSVKNSGTNAELEPVVEERPADRADRIRPSHPWVEK